MNKAQQAIATIAAQARYTSLDEKKTVFKQQLNLLEIFLEKEELEEVKKFMNSLLDRDLFF